ncbi:integral membrane protein [Moniliophthora roreri MCA 2997]|uniref:Integral membrane protein n=1 Tax=Moniliophthora roreri (strain MCA 2997) TaxID=1381753 RepID=V2XS67_MONRO|nr:integral membrane protein [Moniliophthora roreri MCA 2997]
MSLATLWSTLMAELPPWLHYPAQVFVLATTSTWLASVVTGNASHMDRLWPFMPTIYTVYFTLLPCWPNEQKWILTPYVPKEVTEQSIARYGIDPTKDFSLRALIIVGLVAAWTVRQVYNTYRKGLYDSSAEDYRWEVVRKSMPGWAFQIFNLVFTVFRNLLVLGLSLSAAISVVAQPHDEILITDIVLDAMSLGILFMEFIADNQQWSFQLYKQSVLTNRKTAYYTPSRQWFFSKLSWTPADAKRGFITRGMFAWVRHPNFWCEQEFWWAISFFPFLAAPWFQSFIFRSKAYPPTDPIVFWAIPAPLTLLFTLMGSMVLTERISSSKYPDYKYYQERLGMYMMSYTWRYEIALLFSKRTQERDAEIRRALWGKEKTM